MKSGGKSRSVSTATRPDGLEIVGDRSVSAEVSVSGKGHFDPSCMQCDAVDDDDGAARGDEPCGTSVGAIAPKGAACVRGMYADLMRASRLRLNGQKGPSGGGGRDGVRCLRLRR